MAQMKSVVVLFALCLLAPLIAAKSTGFQPCNKKADYTVKVTGLDIDPSPISRGKKTTFEIAASTNKAISGGKLKIEVSYFGFHIHTEDQNLCEQTGCPVSVGDFLVSHSQELPGITPPGNYNLKMTMLDADNKQLTCITFDFSIGFIAPETLADI
ncbi:hypothetical protein ACJIZ3_018971 [Penstemon smallii]|uniref:MD-2-related lipid-recognition domain-containing protein n=1 Tax=Penstemon smallii TaxID=265156 RepID=A0ABD3SZU8_9LAMI